MIAVTSPGFVLFAALLAGLWYACPPPRRWQLMLGANLVFYAVLCWQALPVLLACTFLVWWCGRRTAAKGTFYAGLAAALFPLLLLKYLPAAFGWQGKLANALGIGYFTLQLISYLCDVRRGKLLPEEQYARLLCYASFFLSITQGPFNRYDELMPQMDRPARWDTARAWRGVQRSAWGYFKKLAVADRAAVVVDAVFANPAAYDRTQLLLGSVLFTVQLYADFSGYTDIVLGVGEVLGLTLPENFRQPFFADSVKDIWARWHISLSRWLRDYVYIPLGGSRCTKAQKDRNLLLTFLVSGLWHGAATSFLVWGLLNGIYQVIGSITAPLRARVRSALRLEDNGKLTVLWQMLCVFVLATVAWTFFEAGSVSGAIDVLRACAGSPLWAAPLSAMGMDKWEFVVAAVSCIVMLIADILHFRHGDQAERAADKPWPLRCLLLLALLFASLIFGSYGTGYDAQSFIYGQF